MILIGIHELSQSFTTRPLFNNLTFSIESGERIGLIGPNGAGKSTLLRILARQLQPDSGQISIQKGLRIAFLEQVPRFRASATIHETILEGALHPGEWEDIARAQELTSKLELSRFNEEMPVDRLSGGWKKRVALARELMRQPDLFLLDEPTNHLDIESILWLETLLAESKFATVTITHDRLFLQRVSNRIVELDRRHGEGLLSVKGDYATFLDVRAQLMDAQERHETKLKNTLRRETEWLRRGAKARQTKQQARIQNAKELAERVEDLSSRNRIGQVRLEFQSAEKNPKKLVEAKGVSKSFGGTLVVPPLDLVITPKSRIGLMGPNGSGKSTLIRLLTKSEISDSGTVAHADRLKVAYFEQNRESLDPNLSVLKTICPTGDHIVYKGQSVHVKSYLSRFLFAYDQADLEVRKLSGGEQSRLQLARLMLQESNLLVLDEPTNDLDMSTLDVLADVLAEFDGAVLLVTHDRYFLDQVTNRILAFGRDERGRKTIESMVGLEQWEQWHDEQIRREAKSNGKEEERNFSEASGLVKKKKLSYKDQRELDGMESAIEAAETKMAELSAECSKPENVSNPVRLTELSSELAKAEAEVQRLYARWSELSE